jgi:hypothetical protein
LLCEAKRARRFIAALVLPHLSGFRVSSIISGKSYNPLENIWEYLRQNKLAHRLYDDYQAIVGASCQACNDLIKTPERIASITQRGWANVS